MTEDDPYYECLKENERLRGELKKANDKLEEAALKIRIQPNRIPTIESCQEIIRSLKEPQE